MVGNSTESSSVPVPGRRENLRMSDRSPTKSPGGSGTWIRKIRGKASPARAVRAWTADFPGEGLPGLFPSGETPQTGTFWDFIGKGRNLRAADGLLRSPRTPRRRRMAARLRPMSEPLRTGAFCPTLRLAFALRESWELRIRPASLVRAAHQPSHY